MTLEQRILALAQTMAATCKAQRQEITALQQRMATAETTIAALKTASDANTLAMASLLQTSSQNNKLILKVLGL